LLSDVRLGIDTGLIDEVDAGVIKKLMVALQPACLQAGAGKELEGMERDMERALVINKRMGTGKV
jgi:protein arginine kinase